MNDILNGLSVKLAVIFAVIANAFNDTFNGFSESVISPVAFAASDGAACVKKSVCDRNEIEEIRQFGLDKPVREVINGAVITFAASKKPSVESVLNSPSECESETDSDEIKRGIFDGIPSSMSEIISSIDESHVEEGHKSVHELREE